MWVLNSIYCNGFFQEKESWDMITQKKIEAASNKKEEGNVLFTAGKYARASKKIWEGTCHKELAEQQKVLLALLFVVGCDVPWPIPSFTCIGYAVHWVWLCLWRGGQKAG